MAYVSQAALAAGAAQKRILKILNDGAATSPSSALPLGDLKGVELKCLDGLTRRGLVREGKPGTYWVDEERLAAYESRQRNAVIVVLAVLTAIVAWLVLSAHP